MTKPHSTEIPIACWIYGALALLSLALTISGAALLRHVVLRKLSPEHNDEFYEKPYQTNEFCLIGEYVTLPLGLNSLERYHALSNIRILFNGTKVVPKSSSGVHETLGGLIPRDTQFGYQGAEPRLMTNVGLISFRIPKTDALVGRTVPVIYGYRFSFPVLLTNRAPFQFVWNSAELAGMTNVRIGSIQEHDFFRRASYIFWCVEVLCLLATIVFIRQAIKHDGTRASTSKTIRGVKPLN